VVERLRPALPDLPAPVHRAVETTYDRHPFLGYGYDGLTFGHFVTTIPSVIALRHPPKNTWVLTFAIVACLAVVPFAEVVGATRGIPAFWRVVDSFLGMAGLVALLVLGRRTEA
jgi:hypothetical protein